MLFHLYFFNVCWWNIFTIGCLYRALSIIIVFLVLHHCRPGYSGEGHQGPNEFYLSKEEEEVWGQGPETIKEMIFRLKFKFS